MYIPDKIKVVGIAGPGRGARRFDIRSADAGHENEQIIFAAATIGFGPNGQVAVTVSYMRQSEHDNHRYDVTYGNDEVVLDIQYNIPAGSTN